MSVSRGPAVAGSLLALLAGVTTVRPGSVSGLTTDGGMIALVGLVTAVVGIAVATERLGSSDRRGSLPSVEERTAATVPGDDFDRDLATLDPAVRDRLQDAAVRAIARREGCSTATARETVETGEWTDDASAAALFSADIEAPSTRGERVRAILAGRPAGNVVESVRAAVGAVAGLAGVDLPNGTPGPPDEPPERLHPGNRPTRVDGGDPGGSARTGDGTDLSPDTTIPLPSVGGSIDRPTGRWRGLGGLALVAVGAGAFLGRPGLFAVGAVAGAVTAHAAAGRAGTSPEVDLAVEREVSDPEPDPGQKVGVRVTVHNEGPTVPDLRFLDGVPPGLLVVEGSPRAGGRLPAGGTIEFYYEVEAETGVHRFDPSVAIARDGPGTSERIIRIGGGESAITCRITPGGRAVELRAETLRQTGRIPSDSGGTGVEFYGTREYRRGDPMALIDWKRYARTGELSTVEFEEERATSVVMVVDARRESYRTSVPGGRSAVRVGAEAAAAIGEALLDRGDRVGLAALSPEECWLPPGGGRNQRTRLREELSTGRALSPTPPALPVVGSVEVTRLRRRLPGEAQVLLVSPLVDDVPVDLARSLEAAGHSVTVLGPDPTATATTGQLLARVERTLRISDLRGAGIPVLDWKLRESLAVAIERASRRGGGSA